MPEVPNLVKTEAAIIEQTNSFRRSQQLGTVKPNAQLTHAARRYAEYLAKSGKFAHDADGRQPAERVKAAGYDYCMVAENLAMHRDSRGFMTQQLATKAVEGWKGSPGHRKNLVAPHATEIGVGVARAPAASPKFLSVQLFGRPASEKYRFRIDNKTDASASYTALGKAHTIEPGARVTHSACMPAELSFERSGNALFGVTLKGRYQPRDGAVYTVTKTADGKVDVSVGKAQ